MKYIAEVTEIQHVLRTYVIDANSPEEAEHKAVIGDTSEEWDAPTCPSVAGREVHQVKPSQ